MAKIKQTQDSHLDYEALNREFCDLLAQHSEDTEISNDEDRDDYDKTFAFDDVRDVTPEEEIAPIYNAFRELCNRHEAEHLKDRAWWVYGQSTDEESKDYPQNIFDVYVTEKD